MRKYLPLSVVVLIVGCDTGPHLAPVKGTITMDGKPLVGAGVSFYPETAQPAALAPPSIGKTNENGEYTLATIEGKPGAVVGKHRVSLTQMLPDTGDDPGGDAPAKVIKRAPVPGALIDRIPAKYQGNKSELSCDVPSRGRTDANFDLKSK